MVKIFMQQPDGVIILQKTKSAAVIEADKNDQTGNTNLTSTLGPAAMPPQTPTAHALVDNGRASVLSAVNKADQNRNSLFSPTHGGL